MRPCRSCAGLGGGGCPFEDDLPEASFITAYCKIFESLVHSEEVDAARRAAQIEWAADVSRDSHGHQPQCRAMLEDIAIRWGDLTGKARRRCSEMSPIIFLPR